MIANPRVLDAVSRLTGVPVVELKRATTPNVSLAPSHDSLDTLELLMELEDEFDEATVNWALRYVEALSARPETRRSDQRFESPRKARDPLWDRDLDG